MTTSSTRTRSRPFRLDRTRSRTAPTCVVESGATQPRLVDDEAWPAQRRDPLYYPDPAGWSAAWPRRRSQPPSPCKSPGRGRRLRVAGGKRPTEAAGEGRDGGGPSTFGGVWEWTSSHFLPYPGFEAFPYAEYSEVFFGDEYRVLRGGSWATDPLVARPTFRNWDYPQRRQIFAGFRCASDA